MDLKKISLSLPYDRGYDIIIGENALLSLPDFISSNFKDYRLVIITDNTVKRIFYDNLIGVLSTIDNNVMCLSFNAGEASKKLSTIENLASQMVEAGLTRQTLVLALGGGVVGDIAGFLSAVYMRSVPFIQIPTTLLAMVDSSVGGKTGVDLPRGKNLIGSFYQPSTVIIDTLFLETLPFNQFKQGLAESAKYAIGLDASLFDFFNNNINNIKNLEPDTLIYLINSCCDNKAKVVSGDEHDRGMRHLLNLGHTVGHGLEASSGYKLGHGDCVSIGMCVAARISVLLNMISEEEEASCKDLLNRLGLPVSIPEGFSSANIIMAMKHDKKRLIDQHIMVLLNGIGKSCVIKDVDEHIIIKAIEALS